MIDIDVLSDFNNKLSDINYEINDVETIEKQTLYSSIIDCIVWIIASAGFFYFSNDMLNDLEHFSNTRDICAILMPFFSSIVLCIFIYFKPKDESNIFFNLFVSFLVFIFSLIPSFVIVFILNNIFNFLDVESILIYSRSFICVLGVIFLYTLVRDAWKIPFKNNKEYQLYVKKKEREHKLNSLSLFKKKNLIRNELITEINTLDDYISFRYIVTENKFSELKSFYKDMELKILKNYPEYSDFKELEKDYHMNKLNKKKMVLLNH